MSQYSHENTCVGVFFNKDADLQACNFIQKRLQSLYNKIAGLKVCIFIKKRLKRRYFPVDIAKFLKTPILRNIYEPQLLPVASVYIPR